MSSTRAARDRLAVLLRRWPSELLLDDANPQRPGDGDRPQGQYANYLEIGTNPLEVVLDFGQTYENDTRIHTRIITNPHFALEFLRLMQQALADAIGEDD